MSSVTIVFYFNFWWFSIFSIFYDSFCSSSVWIDDNYSMSSVTIVNYFSFWWFSILTVFSIFSIFSVSSILTVFDDCCSCRTIWICYSYSVSSITVVYYFSFWWFSIFSVFNNSSSFWSIWISNDDCVCSIFIINNLSCWWFSILTILTVFSVFSVFSVCYEFTAYYFFFSKFTVSVFVEVSDNPVTLFAIFFASFYDYFWWFSVFSWLTIFSWCSWLSVFAVFSI